MIGFRRYKGYRMPRPEKLEELSDLIAWIHDHDGRIDAYWANQHDWNGKIELRLDRFDVRMTAVEKRIMWFAGAAAATGSLVGAVITKLLQG